MHPDKSHDSFKTRSQLETKKGVVHFYDLKKAAAAGIKHFKSLPRSLKVLLENQIRHEDGKAVSRQTLQAFDAWIEAKGTSSQEIAYYPARILMQDFTGVPAVVDLAAMRDAIVKKGGDPLKVNPLSPVDLVIDHSVTVDHYGTSRSFDENVKLEFERNLERYEFLKWAQTAFKQFRVVPPGTGICHQVNLEYLASVVFTEKDASGATWAFPDTCVGTDSHTTMINGLGVLGWGVGGIEAEAAMLAQPVSMIIPEVVGFELKGKLSEGVTATDLVLRVTEMLRKKGVVGKFVEFFGSGLDVLTLADRATIANMAPEYGATCGFFPVDEVTTRYLRLTGRDEAQIALVEAYCKAQGLWRHAAEDASLVFTDKLELDLSSVSAALAGPRRPQDRVVLENVTKSFHSALTDTFKASPAQAHVQLDKVGFELSHGSVVLAAITSCTNTSNPAVMLAAGLVAKKAVEKGLKVMPWVKTSLAPGSQVVTDYLEASGLQSYLDAIGFNLVGYGCTTCIGNSGPLRSEISEVIHKNGLVAAAVLSGNRNFEGRISPDVKANYLASPPLVVAYAILGSVAKDIRNEPLGKDPDGVPVYLRDIWPSNQEIQDVMDQAVTREAFVKRYANVFLGPQEWQAVKAPTSQTFVWNDDSTYIQNPPYFKSKQIAKPTDDIIAAVPLLVLGDSITTDHISPAGSIKTSSAAGAFLLEKGIKKQDFNSYGARRGNHEVMMRGTFANIRIKNELLKDVEGPFAKHVPTGETLSIYEVAMRYQAEATPLVVFAGKEYGTGSSRDWAAKGTKLLGIRAVIAESFERIHRSNLVGMGVLPLVFTGGKTRADLKLDGSEKVSIKGLSHLSPGIELAVEVVSARGTDRINVLCRIDTEDELLYFKAGGILNYVLQGL